MHTPTLALALLLPFISALAPPPPLLTTTTPHPLPYHLSFLCNGRAFGTNLNNTSCQDAIRLVGRDTRLLTFGMRPEDPLEPPATTPPFDIILPHRWMSPDGRCSIEAALRPGEEIARASREDVAVAAFVVVRNCAGGGEEAMEGNRGGIARDIGGDNNLRIVVSAYDTTLLRCYGRLPPATTASACQPILDTMATADDTVLFGPRGGPADVPLPFLILSDDHRCKLTIRTTGPAPGKSDHWSWGKFWEVAVALVDVCARAGKEGVQGGLGDNGYLYMEIGGAQSALAGGNGTVS